MNTALFALFLLSAFTSSHLHSATTSFVLDTDEDALRNGCSYYFLPDLRGRGVGLGLAPTGNEICPLTVVQSSTELPEGLPIMLLLSPSIPFILAGYNLVISFTELPPTCLKTSHLWTVVEESEGYWGVKITGCEDAVPGWFHIEEYAGNYKFRFFSIDSDLCRDLGVYIDDDGNRRLVLTEEDPLWVSFKKTSSSVA